jgi:tetratricopeptide (TPR) repeat protein
MAQAFEQLAMAAESRGEFAEAIGWRKRGFALDPLSSASTMKLIATMAAAGDRSGALQQARVHELLVREQLELEPDASFRALVERLRGQTPTTVASSATSPSGLAAAETPRSSPEASREIAQTLEAPPSSQPQFEAARESIEKTASLAQTASSLKKGRGTRGWLKRGGIGTILVLSSLALGVAIIPRDRLTATAATLQQPVVVAPFRVTGADASLGYLREGLVELLSVRLADDSTAHAIDPGAVLSAWRSTRAAGDVEQLPRAEAVGVARRLGAEYVVVGSVVGGASRLVVTASLIAVSTDRVRAQTAVEGPSDSLTALVNRLASKLIAATAGEDDRFTDRTTPSPSALRAYLDGQSAYRRGEYTHAMTFYERALRLDSSFALAAFHLALAADQINGAEQHDRALTLAWANRHDLTERDLVHLIAFAGPRYPAPSSEAEQLGAWERAVAYSPDRAEVWHELGERFFYHGAVLGLRDGHRRAAVAFRRALAIDPKYLPSRQLLVLLAARSGDTTLLTRVASPRALHDSLGELAPALRWRVALAQRDQQDLKRLRPSLAELSDANLRVIGMTSQFDADGVEDGERALRIRLLRSAASDHIDALLAAHSLALNQGRPILALDLTEQLEELKPGLRAHLRLRVLDALYGDGDTTAAHEAAAALVQYADARPAAAPDLRALQLSDICVLEQWRLAHGVTAGARQAASLLRSSPIPRTLLPVSANQIACAAILDAIWSVSTRQRDALTRVARLDSLMLGGPGVSDAGTYAHIVVARLYSRLGQPSLALEAIRNRTYMTGWPRYLATARREEGRLALQVGDRGGAAESFQEYLALRASAERPVRLHDDSVRAAAVEARTGAGP